MNKLYRVLGKRGRITIPFEMRRRAGFSFNDVLSFTQQDDCTVVVKREKICDGCGEAKRLPARSRMVSPCSNSSMGCLPMNSVQPSFIYL